MGIFKSAAKVSLVINANQTRKHTKRTARELAEQTRIMREGVEPSERQERADYVEGRSPMLQPTLRGAIVAWRKQKEEQSSQPPLT